MWNPWKLATIGLSVMVATALVTGLVVASLGGRDAERQAISSVAPKGGIPMHTSIADCNQVAAAQVGPHDKGAAADGGNGAGKGAAIGGAVGAGGGSLWGLNENRKHDEAYRAAYAQCMASRGYRG